MGVDQRQAADQRDTDAEGRAEWAAEELSAKVAELAELEGANRELADLKEKAEAIKLDPFYNVEYVSQFAYYLAYAYAIRTPKKGGLKVGPLVEAFRSYVLEHPLEPVFTVLILDLAMEHGVDMSWYPSPDSLTQPDAPEDPPHGETLNEGGGTGPVVSEGANADPA
ncbi:hypothetical protein OROHE_014836 [Orobanche hederae]